MTDSVLDAVLAIVDGKNITDAGLAVVRDRIPSGVPRDVFDTLANIVVKHQPVLKATEDLAGHYISQYTAGIGDALTHGLEHTVGPVVSAALAKLPDPKTAFASFPAELKQAAHSISSDAAKALQGAAKHAADEAARTVASAASSAALRAIPVGIRGAVSVAPHAGPHLAAHPPVLPIHLALGAHHA